MQQVFVIHGGDAFAKYEDFIAYLKNKPIDITKLNYRDWKARLGESLDRDHQVLMPSMPNKQNAKYEEWKIWFEKFFPFLDDGIILIGHSLGGCFLAKYLTTENLPKKIRATFLVAAPYDEVEHPELSQYLHNFIPPINLDKFATQSGRIYLYHSKDDPVVSFTELAKYQAVLPASQVKVFNDRGHFNQEQFPEIVTDIKSLK